MRSTHRYSERRICRALVISRSSIRYLPQPRSDEASPRASIIRLASQCGRDGYRMITGLLGQEGWQMSRSQQWLPIPPAQEVITFLGRSDAREGLARHLAKAHYNALCLFPLGNAYSISYPIAGMQYNAVIY